MLLTVVDDALLLLARLGEGVELVILTSVVAIVVEESLVEVLTEGVHLDVELDHVGGVVGLKGDYENSLAIGFDELGDVVFIAFGVGFFEQFLKVVREVLVADNQVLFMLMYSCHSRMI